jgi:diguanylate cyclase (GGDEF)-like protein/PAS domain S-box-containing protein
MPYSGKKESLEGVLDQLLEAIYIVDKDRKILFWNDMAEKITGFSSTEIIGSSCKDDILVHVDDRGNKLCTGLCPLAKTMMDGQQRSVLIFLHHKKGHRLPVHVKTTPFYDEEGRIIGGIEMFNTSVHSDEEQKRIQELERLAYLDELTGIPNRRYFITTLQRKLVEWEHFGSRSAVFMADIDHFKHFNDTYGHEIGDHVLKMVAATLTKSLRGDDICCRWGGEEFTGIIQTGKNEDLREILERVRLLIENSYFIEDGNRISVTLSFGGTVVQRTDREESWIKRADRLMYTSKDEGRNRITIG